MPAVLSDDDYIDIKPLKYVFMAQRCTCSVHCIGMWTLKYVLVHRRGPGVCMYRRARVRIHGDVYEMHF